MSRILPIGSATLKSQSECVDVAGGNVRKQLVLPSLVRREEIADDFRALIKVGIAEDVGFEEFAGTLGIDKSTLSRRLNGKAGYADVDPEMIAAIVEARLPTGVAIGNWIAQQYQCKPLEPLRTVTDAEILAAARAEAADSGALGEAFMQRVASRLGVDVVVVKR